ncbi:hypothetical protein [uncultured Fibrella sp.]|uniref:hypothetical protein n=1 Tax=uncultured Fibrella sp. TaxID=1284596 RepID=UPI0035C99B63
MVKNTITGSLLAKLFPSMSKYFLENASQEQVNQAEQEAAVIHQQLQAAEKPAGVVVAEATPVLAGGAEAVEAVLLEIPAPQQPGAVDVMALTKRATDAEATVTTLQTQLATAEADRDRYKGWYDKQAGAGTRLPGADASTRSQAEGDKQLTAADQYALSLVKGR